MTQPSSPELLSPELDSFEAFLASNPDDLAAFTQIPFGEMLGRVNELGFDGEVLYGELVLTGILDRKTWISAVDLNDDEFLALTPLEYVDRFPDHGLPLLASVLNSIQLSDEQAALHSVAGGTSLNKAQKWEIGIGTVVLANFLVRFKRTLEVKQFLASLDGKPEGRWIDSNGTIVDIKRNWLGYNQVNFTTTSFAARLKHEWMMGLGGLFQEWGMKILGRDIRKEANGILDNPQVDRDLRDNIVRSEDGLGLEKKYVMDPELKKRYYEALARMDDDTREIVDLQMAAYTYSTEGEEYIQRELDIKLNELPLVKDLITKDSRSPSLEWFEELETIEEEEFEQLIHDEVKLIINKAESLEQAATYKAETIGHKLQQTTKEDGENQLLKYQEVVDGTDNRF